MFSTVWSKKMNQSEMSIFLSIFVQIQTYFSWKLRRIISFFLHINKVIGPFLQKISAKSHFFTFSKTGKKCTLTPIFTISKKWLYEFSWSFGIRCIYSIPIFPATQNSIWTHFKESKEFSKMFFFALITDFSLYFLLILCI